MVDGSEKILPASSICGRADGGAGSWAAGMDTEPAELYAAAVLGGIAMWSGLSGLTYTACVLRRLDRPVHFSRLVFFAQAASPLFTSSVCLRSVTTSAVVFDKKRKPDIISDTIRDIDIKAILQYVRTRNSPMPPKPLAAGRQSSARPTVRPTASLASSDSDPVDGDNAHDAESDTEEFTSLTSRRRRRRCGDSQLSDLFSSDPVEAPQSDLLDDVLELPPANKDAIPAAAKSKSDSAVETTDVEAKATTVATTVTTKVSTVTTTEEKPAMKNMKTDWKSIFKMQSAPPKPKPTPTAAAAPSVPAPAPAPASASVSAPTPVAAPATTKTASAAPKVNPFSFMNKNKASSADTPADNVESTVKVDPTDTSTELPFKRLVDVFEQSSKTSKRTEITEYMAEFFVEVMSNYPHLTLPTVYLSTATFAPDHEGVELGVGNKVLTSAIALATSCKPGKLRGAEAAKLGSDLGEIAKSLMNNQMRLKQPKPLTINQLHKSIRGLADITGGHSETEKTKIISGLLSRCTAIEAQYLIRILSGKVGVKMGENTVQSALARAATVVESMKRIAKQKEEGTKPEKVIKLNGESHRETFKQAEANLAKAYSECPDYSLVIPKLIEFGIDEITTHCKLTPGIPVKPMLAHPTKAVSEVIERFEGKKFICEYKYDGHRVQIHHMKDGSTRIFSRNSKELTETYPDLVAAMPRIRRKGKCDDFIIDGEVVAWEPSNNNTEDDSKVEGKILPFQTLTTRKKKGVNEEDIKVQVMIFAFDMLYVNGRSLLQERLDERRKLLFECIMPVRNVITFATSMISTDLDEISTFLDASVDGNCEGLIVKSLDDEGATYEPSHRSHSWLKLKKDYLEGVGDSLDLIVVGAKLGTGKRAGTYGAYYLCCYEPKSSQYQLVCKVGTGFSDADLQNHFNALQDHIIPKPRYDYHLPASRSDYPDVWFDGKLVWEIKCADLQISPKYTAGMGMVHEDKGISIRFPRFIRDRDDKDPEDITTSHQVCDMYLAQKINHGLDAQPIKAGTKRIAAEEEEEEDDDDDNDDNDDNDESDSNGDKASSDKEEERPKAKPVSISKNKASAGPPPKKPMFKNPLDDEFGEDFI
ncbi:ATP-dependent DNA ligase [Ramicandelaber brevisporus]|nr:ATP-dependent DNA ligase [Ramicandelaber brevisporus]